MSNNPHAITLDHYVQGKMSIVRHIPHTRESDTVRVGDPTHPWEYESQVDPIDTPEDSHNIIRHALYNGGEPCDPCDIGDDCDWHWYRDHGGVLYAVNIYA
jgi:hypothetical protein